MTSSQDGDEIQAEQLMELEQSINPNRLAALASLHTDKTVHVLSAEAKIWLFKAIDILQQYPQIINTVEPLAAHQTILRAQRAILFEAAPLKGAFTRIATALGKTPTADATLETVLCEIYTLLGGTDPCETTAEKLLNQIAGVI